MSVTAEMKRDTISGWNLHVQPRGFKFTPARAGKQAQPRTGHAHLYVDGEKIGRLYSAWMHLPDFEPGRHTLTVELNGDDHRAWIRGTKPVATTVHFTQPEPDSASDGPATPGRLLLSGGLPIGAVIVGADLLQSDSGLRVIPWVRPAAIGRPATTGHSDAHGDDNNAGSPTAASGEHH